MIFVFAVPSKIDNQSLHLCPNPMNSMISMRKGHATVSKAFAISILSSTQRARPACNALQDSRTDRKLSCIDLPLMNAD